MKKNSQESFWEGKFGEGYIARNQGFDRKSADIAWRLMLKKTKGVRRILECGSNIGRNLEALKRVNPMFDLSLIEINPDAYRIAVDRIRPTRSFCGPIVRSTLKPRAYDLTFTCGVLIHIHPDHLLENCRKVVGYSKKYVLACEYFNRTPVSMPYHGESDKLFKRDFGKFYLENFKLKCIDSGFLWSQDYEQAGFDDVTWWLFEKK